MNYTLAQLEALLSKRIKDDISGTTTTIGASDGTTFTSTGLLVYPNQTFVPYYCELTSGTYSGQIRVIQDCTTGVVTLWNAFGGQVASGVTFKLYRIPTAWKKEAIEEVLREFHAIVPVVAYDSVITGELVRNGNMEFWESTASPFDWTASSGTLARETTTIYQGKCSLSLVGAASTCTQTIPLSQELEGVTLSLTGYARGKIANGTKIGVSLDGTDNWSSSVAADNTWEQLTKSVTISGAFKTITVKLYNNHASEAGYFDVVSLRVQLTDTVYWIPISRFFRQVSNITIGALESSGKTYSSLYRDGHMPQFFERGYGWYKLGSLPHPYYTQIIGEGKYITLSADSDSLDIETDQAQLLVVQAAMRALHKAKAFDHLSTPDHWTAMEADLKLEEASLILKCRKAKPAKRYASWR